MHFVEGRPTNIVLEQQTPHIFCDYMFGSQVGVYVRSVLLYKTL